MIELLSRARADDCAVVTDDESVSYGDLVERAYRFAAGLRAGGIRRFAVVDHDAATVTALLAGAALVGAEPCQYPPLADADEIAQLCQRFDHAVVVTERFDESWTVSPEALAARSSVEPGSPHAAPLLVLTTGTTGAPRGVRHDWSRLLRRVERVKPAPDERWLLAYGLHQFAGLQILIHVYAAGATLVAPTPRRPREGLASMYAHRVTHASATPTYWRFLLAELHGAKWPAPHLYQITLGGEAVPPALLPYLRTTFPEARISQIYAASEFGSTGSVRDERAGLSADFLGRGDDADIALKVVDGQLWVRSRVGMLGYYGDQPTDPDAWRPTGDLVEVVDDRIVFQGRTSDVINVGGVKVHPLPIEERVSAVPGVLMARVFGRKNAMTGAIVAVEAVAGPGANPQAVADAIRTACADLPPAARPRSIRFVDAVATTGGKVVRRST